ncbi:MAG TPA: hypothetical protein VJT31_41985 [Rugosimonospora sp.]|nr:hypothetical protein [Rugosimonospora sp.]
MTAFRTTAALAAVGVLTLAASGCLKPTADPNAAKPGVIYPTRTPATPNNSAGPGSQIAHAASVAAQQAVDRYASGDYAGAWETYTEAGQKAISKADFVKFNTECPPKFLHSTATVTGVQLKSLNTAVVGVTIGGQQAQYLLMFERGQWRLQPSAAAMANFKLGVAKAVQKEKAAGAC